MIGTADRALFEQHTNAGRIFHADGTRAEAQIPRVQKRERLVAVLKRQIGNPDFSTRRIEGIIFYIHIYIIQSKTRVSLIIVIVLSQK